MFSKIKKEFNMNINDVLPILIVPVNKLAPTYRAASDGKFERITHIPRNARNAVVNDESQKNKPTVVKTFELSGTTYCDRNALRDGPRVF